MAFRIELSKRATRAELNSPLPDGSTRNPFFDKLVELSLHGYKLRGRGNKYVLQVDDDDLLNLKDAVDWVAQAETLYGNKNAVEIKGLQGYYRATENALAREIPASLGFDDVVVTPAVPGYPALDAVVVEGVEVRPAYPAIPAVDEVVRRPTIGELASDFTFEGFTYGPLPGKAVSDFAALEQVQGVKVVTPKAYQNKKAEYEASLGTGQ